MLAYRRHSDAQLWTLNPPSHGQPLGKLTYCTWQLFGTRLPFPWPCYHGGPSHATCVSSSNSRSCWDVKHVCCAWDWTMCIWLHVSCEFVMFTCALITRLLCAR
jgi:hypothetical protein